MGTDRSYVVLTMFCTECKHLDDYIVRHGKKPVCKVCSSPNVRIADDDDIRAAGARHASWSH